MSKPLQELADMPSRRNIVLGVAMHGGLACVLFVAGIAYALNGRWSAVPWLVLFGIAEGLRATFFFARSTLVLVVLSGARLACIFCALAYVVAFIAGFGHFDVVFWLIFSALMIGLAAFVAYFFVAVAPRNRVPV